jgi:hypothetical protein
LKQRKDAWQKVSDEFNATSMSAPKGAEQLKILWSNLRRTAKKTVAKENVSMWYLKFDLITFTCIAEKKIWIKIKMRMW